VADTDSVLMFAIYTFGQDEKKGQAKINQVEVVEVFGVAASSQPGSLDASHSLVST
jgi:hypothetical protein